jgi:hypothetical protein
MHIPIEQRVTAIAFSVTLVVVIVQLIRKQKLREQYALAWLGAGLGILLLSVFGDLVGLLARLFAVSYAPTLALVLGLLFALVVLLSQSVVISGQADCIRDLAQSVTLLEWRLRQLEEAESRPGLSKNGLLAHNGHTTANGMTTIDEEALQENGL